MCAQHYSHVLFGFEWFLGFSLLVEKPQAGLCGAPLVTLQTTRGCLLLLVSLHRSVSSAILTSTTPIKFHVVALTCDNIQVNPFVAVTAFHLQI